MSNKQTAINTTYFSIVGNFLLAAIKGVAGFFGNSYALIADAMESATDIFSSALVLFGLKYANRPADKNHPYGHGRAEPLVTFLVVGFFLAILIVWKEFSFRLVMRKGDETNSSALKADAWHHRSDAITSVAAFIGITIALILGKGYESADDWAALFAAGFIYYNSYLIFRPALSEIMDENLYDELIDQIRHVSLQVEGIKNTEKCFIRKAGMEYHVDLHAKVAATISVKEGHDISHKLKDTLRKEIPSLGHILIHIEPYES